jgi:hypothetical protein
MSVVAVTVRDMKHVLKVRVLPTEVQAAALEATLLACNEAASWLSSRMHVSGCTESMTHRSVSMAS